MAKQSVLGKEYYTRVEELKAGGMSRADAIREVGNSYSPPKSENTIRAGIYNYTRGLRDRSKTADSYLADARVSLEAAKKALEDDVVRIHAELGKAQKAYDNAVRTRDTRVAEIDKQLQGLP